MTDTMHGYTLLEALLAMAFAGLLFFGAFGLLLTASQTSSESTLRQKALWKAEQGIRALETMSFEDLFLTEVGSLSFSADQWVLGVAGPDDIGDGMTRIVRVQEAQRDTECQLVPSGGDTDTDSVYLESEVTWTGLRGNPHTITLRTLRTNWSNPDDSCFASDCSQLDWDVLGSEWFGGKQLREVYITNNTGETKEIDTITITWNNTAVIQQVFFDSQKFWSSTGPGTPLGTQGSGVVLDGENGDIPDGETVEMHKTQFDQNMEGTTITVTYECTDGSAVTFGPFVPSD
ncbi:hypothetical protein EPN81_02115 [Patescibacteria group bacterium]|nr:MAG: hypothetical protein EPN81_02115 [Patescibacteria group bacterium]